MNDFVSEYALKVADGYFWELDEPSIEWHAHGQKRGAAQHKTVHEIIVNSHHNAGRVATRVQALALVACLLASFLFLFIAITEFVSGRMFFVVPALTLSLTSLMVMGAVRERQRG